ncbi:hypothetical protein B0H16DRAFT_1211608, partial [Mycena metata]
FTFQAYPNPTPPVPPAGSYKHDLASGSYPLQWANWDDFHNWRTAEECAQCYPGASLILGNYHSEHNHPIGNPNLRFTQISKETKEYIAGLLRLKVAPDHILHLLHHGVYNHNDLFEHDQDGSSAAARNKFIQLRDIQRIEKNIEAESVRLHPDD